MANIIMSILIIEKNHNEVVVMAEKYEYHKQNEYPGERIAERERVAAREKDADRRADDRVAEKGRTEGRKADARVAEKGRTEGRKADARVARRGRMDDELMDDEIQRSSNRAIRVSRKRDTADAIGMVIIAGLIVFILIGSFWGFRIIQQQSDEIASLNSQLDRANSDNYQLSLANSQSFGKIDTTPPTILYLSPLTSVSPSNNEMDVAVRVPITVMFSEDMDPLTINKNTFKVEQRGTSEPGTYPTLQIAGTVSYADRKATFISDDRFWPNQIYGNVFTVTITTGVKDIAGNSLVDNYIWSFTTGSLPFPTDKTTSQQ